MMPLLNVVLFSVCLGAVRADLPVHCLKQQVEGDWDFFLGAPSSKRSSCGHRHPDLEDAQPDRQVVSFANGGTKQRVSLQSPNVAKMNGERGTWTMIYDEGFEVNIGGRTFMAFSNFTLKDDAVTHEKKNFSHCGDTMVGWYRNADRTAFGCYYGVKSEKPESTPLPASSVETAPEQATKLSHAAMAKKVAKLNVKLSMLQMGWKARSMPQWVGKTTQQINSYAGLHRTTPVRNMRTEMMNQRSNARHPSFLQRLSKLPETFDWSNASGGIDWLEPVMDQGDCGSCYAASTMRMISTRHKIAVNDPDAIPFSINMPLHCGEYNQGCKGGYGSLIAKWGEDVGLVPATCMRYDTHGSCKLECDLAKLEGKRYRVANHRLIGGWYGNSSEKAMMEEIYNNGPIVVSFEPAEDFMFYSEGIYRTVVDNSSHTTAPAAEDRVKQPWKKVDHAVLAVGWGVEDGKKYWRVQNSWGPDWGEDGFFRMARGEDESGIESIPEAAEVVEDEQNGQRVVEFFEQMSKA